MGFEYITQPQFFTTTVCAADLRATELYYTNLTAVAELSVLNDPAVVTTLKSLYTHAQIVTSVAISSTNISTSTIFTNTVTATNITTDTVVTDTITAADITTSVLNVSRILSAGQEIPSQFVSNTTFNPLSSRYEDVSSIVQANSASWEESADILPTVTNYLSTEHVIVSSLNVTSYQVSSVTVSNIEFADADSGKTFHLNTTTTPSVTAQFPGNLSNGFNVSIINAGLGSIFLSAGSPLNASGSENSTPFSGMFIYKTNNELFGVGVFV